MADGTKLIIELQTILRGLNQTLRGLDQIKKKLDSVAAIKVGVQPTQNTSKATIAAQKLSQQQEKLGVQARELANRQERARQVTERLALSQQRLSTAQQRTARTTGAQADAHVRAFRAIQKGIDTADGHVKAFRASEAALARAPQLDAHVRAFRAAEAATEAFNKKVAGLGNSLRSIGQGLSTVGATLSATLTLPLVAAGAASVNAAVQLDSLKRGLTAIVGSSVEANRQLERLTQIAKLPGIGFEEAIQGSIRLQAVGFSALEAERSLRQFSNAIALTGGGRDELARVTVQLGQLAAKGKVLSQDLRPIIEAAPAVGRALLQAFGTVNAADIQELGLSSKEFLGILVGELERLPRAAAGAKNSFENFRDEVFRAAATVGEALLPALTRLVEVVGPVITTLANAFGKLPTAVQVVVIGFGALLAALGPLAFITGQLATGFGRLLVGFAQLNAIGILPTIRNLRALVAGTLTAAQANRTLAATTALVTGAVGLIAAAITLAVGIYAGYKATQKDSVRLSREQADALTDQINGLKKQSEFLGTLESGTKRTADEQDRLLEIYESLNRTAKVRVTGIKDEEERLAALREEIARVVALREQERIQQAASVTAELANNLLKVKANEEERDAIAGRIQANNELVQTLEKEQVISAASTRALAERSITASTVQSAIGALKTESENLSESQDELIASSKELTALTKDEVEIVRALERQTGLTARQLLLAAQSSGKFRGDIATIIPILERYVEQTDAATKATDRLNKSLSENAAKLNEAGQRADDAAKARQTIISSAAAVARETSLNFDGALKSLRQMVNAVPELAASLKRESELTGKTLNELLQEALEGSFRGREKDKSGTALRNAQEQLNDALARVQQSANDRTIAEEQAKNDQLLRINELRFNRELTSFKQFVVERARLQRQQVQGEIDRQQEIARLADEEARRQRERAGVTTGAERIKAQAGEQKALAERTQAETKILELQSRQRQVFADTARDLDQFTEERQQSFRELNRELDEIIGKEGRAAEAAIDERFASQLRELRNELKLAGQDLIGAQAAGSRAGQAAAAATLGQLRNQIASIENHKRLLRAVGEVAEAQEEIRRAEEAQRNLEEQLTSQVEFRGLAEEDAIRKRLEGEQKVRAVVEQQQVRLEILAATLKAAGLEIPLALAEAVERLKAAIGGLGELSLGEQFRLVQKEFDRLNEERLRKIADIERAIRERDIAEIEGLLIIRRINGQYAADLEQQLVLLKQIAAQSNDANLIRQAQSAEDTVKDANSQLADFNHQLRSASIDALREGFTNFFASITDRTKTAKEKLLDLVNSVTERIQQVIAENLSEKLIQSLFGDGTEKGGILASIGRLFGLGGGGGIGSAGGLGEAAGAAQTAQATAAATALTAGATAASAALVTGGVTAGTALVTSATAAAASIVAAGVAFAATVAAASAASGVSQGLGGLGAGLGAATGLFPAVPGGVVRVVEGGFPEAVLTTDPKHAVRQVAILREFLRHTRGLGGRVRGLAAGGFAMPELALNVQGMALATGGLGAMEISGAPTVNVRNINQINRGEIVRGYLRSAEGVTDILNVISENAPDIGRRIGVK
jgi:tape measure domain-containing protein